MEDDAKVRLLLRRCLESDGYNVVEAATGDELEQFLLSGTPDLITLDLQLGHENGLSLAAKIRSTSDVPIIMVTGKGETIDKIVGLEMGADDYITKPFHVREVLARVRTVLRRARITDVSTHTNPHMKADAAEVLVFDGWTVKPQSMELFGPDGTQCEISTVDFKLLMVFLQNPRRVLSRDRIMDLTKGYEWTPNDRTIDNQVARLRKKIEEDPAMPRLIKTVRGIGYMFTRKVINSIT